MKSTITKSQISLMIYAAELVGFNKEDATNKVFFYIKENSLEII